MLTSPYTEPVFSFFRYGDSSEKKHLGKTKSGNLRKGEMLHTLTERGLVEKLAKSTRTLLVLPHNLMTFLAVVSPHDLRDQTTSRATRNHEEYYRILGKYLTLLEKDCF